MTTTLFHRRCESIEASLRARISDLESTREQEREAAHDRETELFNRLMALTNPGAHAAIVAANRSDKPASGLPGIPLRKQILPSTSPYVRDRVVSLGGGTSPLLRPAEVAPAPLTSTAAKS